MIVLWLQCASLKWIFYLPLKLIKISTFQFSKMDFTWSVVIMRRRIIREMLRNTLKNKFQIENQWTISWIGINKSRKSDNQNLLPTMTWQFKNERGPPNPEPKDPWPNLRLQGRLPLPQADHQPKQEGLGQQDSFSFNRCCRKLETRSGKLFKKDFFVLLAINFIRILVKINKLINIKYIFWPPQVVLMVRQFAVDVNSLDKIYSEGNDIRFVSKHFLKIIPS